MPTEVTTYKDGGKEYLEVCPLDSCKHPVGKKVHHIFEFPKDSDRAAFIEDALKAVSEKEE